MERSYVFGDSFIESGSTSNAYAGIFILVCTSVPTDAENYIAKYDEDGNIVGTREMNEEERAAFDEGVLPLDYIIEYGSTLKDCVTIRQQIEDTLLSGKQSAIYEEKNCFVRATVMVLTYVRVRSAP